MTGCHGSRGKPDFKNDHLHAFNPLGLTRCEARRARIPCYKGDELHPGGTENGTEQLGICRDVCGGHRWLSDRSRDRLGPASQAGRMRRLGPSLQTWNVN